MPKQKTLIDKAVVEAGQRTPRLSVSGIERATKFIDAVFRDTPQFMPEHLASQFNCRFVVKVETANPIRSFKARGAQALVSQLPGTPHLACVTAGNFGQGMAYAARARGLRLTTFAKSDANNFKIDRIRRLGADVRLVDGDLDAVHSAAKAFVNERNALLIEVGREPAIAEGAGTIGIELLRWKDPLDIIVVPLGSGALLCGLATYLRARSPATRIVGVCARGAPAMERSWRLRSVQSTVPDTIADGISVQTPSVESVTKLVRLVDDILLVDDDAIVKAMRVAYCELGIVLEPAGAAGLAALLEHGVQFRERTVATILTGGNPSTEQLQRISL